MLVFTVSSFLLKLLLPISPSSRYNQVNAISLACRTGLEECQNLVKTWFAEWMNTNNNPWVHRHHPNVQVLFPSALSLVHWTLKMSSLLRIHPNLRSTVYCNAIAAGGAKEWEFAWSEFRNATIASEAEKLRSALSCTKQPWLLNRSVHRHLDHDT